MAEWTRGEALYTNGLFVAAERCFARAVAITADDRAHRDFTLNARLKQVDLWIKLGRFAEAEVALAELRGETSIAEWVDTWLGVCLRMQGRHDEARAAYERAIATLAAAGKPPSAAIQHNLAGLASARGDFVTAERLTRAALERHAAEGAIELLVAVDIAALGDALAGQRRYEEAAAAYRDAIERLRGERTYRDHPELAFALHNLGDALAELGQPTLARAAYRESITRKRRALGAQHHEIAASLANLAVLEHEDGHSEVARKLARRATAIVRRALAPEHPIRTGCEQVAAALA